MDFQTILVEKLTILKHCEKVIVELILYPITTLLEIQNHFFFLYNILIYMTMYHYFLIKIII